MRTILILTLYVATIHSVQAWGPTGHRVTGAIAERYMTKKARQKLEKILGQQSLAMASTWMDEVRSDSAYNHMTDWHWVDIPDGLTYDQSKKNPRGDIIETLERVINALKSQALSPQQEAEYVKILVHLVGDLHMPLHVGRGDDRGGNSIKISWFGSDSNLHRVWDSDMIDDTKLSYTELAASLENPGSGKISEWQKSSILDWAYESMTYRDRVYAIGNGRLGYTYPYKNFHIVRLRLLQSGIRLAGILNEIYG